MRQITVNGTMTNGPVTASVTIEHSEEWRGYSSYIQAFHSEAGRGCEYVIVYYNAVHFKTPYNYEVRVKRRSGHNHWHCDKGDSALVWLRKRRAKFGLGCALVEIDSVRRVITITVNSDAEISTDEATSTVAEA